MGWTQKKAKNFVSLLLGIDIGVDIDIFECNLEGHIKKYPYQKRG